VPPKNGEIRKRLRAESWFIDRTRGSHEQWRHPAKLGIVTIAGKDGQTPPPGTWASIRKQAGWP
jgi:predicted RNA binding protein YcfA (HicA-like mRNA interferase family)